MVNRLAVALIGLALAWLFMVPSPVVTCAVAPSDLLTAIRHARGDTIATSGLLTAVAQRRSQQIVTDYSHNDHGARAPLDGLRFGEVLAYNSYPDDLTVATAVHQWMESPGHRGILLGRWTHVGVGVTASGPSHYYAAIFATLPIPPVPGTDTCQ
jgi:uncharacterized protein YkwD